MEASGKLEEKHKPPDVSRLGFYVDAFHELSSCRINGMGVGQIPFTAIAEYSNIFNVEEFDDFLYFIRVMDNEYLNLVSKDQKAKSQASEKKSKSKK